MRHRTAFKTGRTAAMQSDGLAPRAFSNYVAMVERFSARDFRLLHRRPLAPKRLL